MTNAKHGLDPIELCEPPTDGEPDRDNHLRSAHGELHQELGHILAGETATTQGHIDAGDCYPALFVERHDALAAEIERRGGTHNAGHADEYDSFEAAVAEARRRHPELFEVTPDADRLDELRQRHLDDCAACRGRALRARGHSVGYQRQQARDLKAGEHRARVLENASAQGRSF